MAGRFVRKGLFLNEVPLGLEGGAAGGKAGMKQNLLFRGVRTTMIYNIFSSKI